MTSTLQKPSVASAALEIVHDHWADLKHQIERADRATAGAVREIAIAGDMMLALKSITKHGEFGPTLHRECFAEMTFDEFKSSQWRKANRYMEIAEAVRARLQIGHDVQFDDGTEVTLARLLTFEGENDSKILEIKASAEEILSTNTASQLLLDFRDSKGPHQRHNPIKRSKAERLEAETAAAAQDIRDLMKMMKAVGQPQLWSALSDGQRHSFARELKEALKELNFFLHTVNS